ncbi:hypothetical protein FisN_15Hh093 [Fistulifera solaris]|uniref:Transmembrane protein n=1 Tax=Fistulifera solaris TaxID=1519565 RepID=W0TWQ4_FISSO|nr:transmembrane protein [Fistulifera solaris]GAX23009.1 hypothetical protein FisN_15Hh093 [Fistulifera solaris]|eukprot:GAX23009.1 hypothetical protein FisN_15Hh093 [Fistulifera solaris]
MQTDERKLENAPARKKNLLSSIFSTSNVATLLMTFYVGMAALNLSRLMFPLSFIDISTFPSDTFIRPLWSKASDLHLEVYLSTQKQFSRSFLLESVPLSNNEEEDTVMNPDVQLLLSEKLHFPAFSKSFLLTTLNCDGSLSCDTADSSYKTAVSWIDEAERVASESDDGVLSVMSAAGHGIESTSFLLTIYNSIMKNMKKVMVLLSIISDDETDAPTTLLQLRSTIQLTPDSSIWRHLVSNSTVYVHALLVRTDRDFVWPPESRNTIQSTLQRAQRTHSLQLGDVQMVKYDKPHHIAKPGRILFHDLVYMWKRYVLGDTKAWKPWDMEHFKPSEYRDYHNMLDMKEKGVGYPYWKPEVAIKLVNEDESYPQDLAHASGMPIVRLQKSKDHPTGLAFAPVLHVDEIGLTSEKYIPLNETVTSLPLRVSFDRSDIDHKPKASTATAGGMSPARWRLLSHFGEALEAQKELGFQQEDIDDVRRLIADTNVTLLGVTLLFSALHMLFEFLTFKNEVSFWRNNKDLTGLSVRSLFLDTIGQTVILLFLIEKDSSLLMTIPSAIGCLIALWKCRRAAGLQFCRRTHGTSIAWWNWLPSLFGYELRAVRLDTIAADKEAADKEGDAAAKKKQEVSQMSMEADRMATRRLGSILLPLVLGYTLYSFVYQEHSGWYSWVVTSASSAVYALGFVLMTPQLFLNYKLKSVAHLPWRVLIYKSLNTFIDDLFSFIIRMPTMARISCFRDDVVFFIYLYQRWLYPVDTSRPMEGGDGTSIETTNAEKKKTD